jgi:putative transposase
VHLLVSFPPTVALSRQMRPQFMELAPHYWQAKRLWSGSLQRQLSRRGAPP